MAVIKIEGVQTSIMAMRKKATNTKKTVAEAMYQCAQIVYRKSQKLVPVDTGDLKRCGRVVRGPQTGLQSVSYVEYVNEYAVPVHEILTAYHEPPTQARYLADAVSASRGTMTAAVKRQVLAGTRMI